MRMLGLGRCLCRGLVRPQLQQSYSTQLRLPLLRSWGACAGWLRARRWALPAVKVGLIVQEVTNTAWRITLTYRAVYIFDHVGEMYWPTR